MHGVPPQMCGQVVRPLLGGGASVAPRWGELVTPNSASFFLDRPDKFFLGCPLSPTWQKPDGAGLYLKQ